MFSALGHGWIARFCTRHALRLGAAALAVSAFSGCQSIDVNSTNAAQLRVFNASPDSTGFDFYTGKTGIVFNLGFSYKTTYVSLNPGTQTITTDQASTVPPQVLASVAGSLGSQKSYTVIAGNVLANLQETIFADQNFAAPSGQIAVRVINEATRIGPVDIYLVASGGKLATTLPFATNVTFNGNSGYIDIPAGTYAIAVLPTGTNPGSGTTLFTGSQASYPTGAASTLVVFDTPLTTAPAANVTVLTDYLPTTTTG
jgi:Domain of unknown function (DUF4397)